MTSDKRAKAPPPLPTKADVLKFIEDTGGQINKREIARAFHIRGQDRIHLKKLIKQLIDEGQLERGAGRQLQASGGLPAVAVLEVTGIDHSGDVMARPMKWDREDAPPRIYVTPDQRKAGGAVGRGDRILARLERRDHDGAPHYAAQIIRVLEAAPDGILGVFREGMKEGRLIPVDKKARQEYRVPRGDENQAKDGELVVGEVYGRRSRQGLAQARVTERLGDLKAPKSISLIAIHSHGIPVDFPPEAVKEAMAAQPVTAKGREDLRHLPLITIDPEDARDHDDAVWAETDQDTKNPGGWRVIVAIADVSWYVRSGTALDLEAQKRGNSCYFPDRVVPMLPEELSTDLCSLKPNVDRACLATEMTFDKDGNKKSHRFFRGIMRSAGHITYGAAQAAVEGHPDDATAPLAEQVIRPLYGAFYALMRAKGKREPLDLDMPERRVNLAEDGTVLGVEYRERLDAHRMIEEFMIMANVAAAEEIERRHQPCMYRVHEEPGMEKMEALRDFLKSLELNLAKGQVLLPKIFNRVLRKVANSPLAHLVNQVVLRSQTQAYYSPENMGHFGLALPRYAHFTSPIRRYSDVLVHRALVTGLKLGDGGLALDAVQDFVTIGEEISKTERRAMVAERESKDRYLAAYLFDRVGKTMTGRISGVTRFGLFVELQPSGGDGLVPISSIGDDYYVHDEKMHALVGERSGKRFRLGDEIDVILVEADRVTGRLRLELAGGPARRNSKRKSGSSPHRKSKSKKNRKR